MSSAQTSNLAGSSPDRPVPAKTLDLRGVECPLPPLKTLSALRRMRSGEVLEVLGTSSIGNTTAPFVARALGNQLLHVVVEDDFKRFYYRKR